MEAIEESKLPVKDRLLDRAIGFEGAPNASGTESILGTTASSMDAGQSAGEAGFSMQRRYCEDRDVSRFCLLCGFDAFAAFCDPVEIAGEGDKSMLFEDSEQDAVRGTEGSGCRDSDSELPAGSAVVVGDGASMGDADVSILSEDNEYEAADETLGLAEELEKPTSEADDVGGARKHQEFGAEADDSIGAKRSSEEEVKSSEQAAEDGRSTTHVALETKVEDSVADADVSNVHAAPPTKEAPCSEGEPSERVRSAPASVMYSLSGTPVAHRFDYASKQCGAIVVGGSREAENLGNVINPSSQAYALMPCRARKWVSIKLCEDVLVDTIALANFEFFSSTFRNVSFKGGIGANEADWVVVGRAVANNTRETQYFELESGPVWLRYVRIEVDSHFGNEHYCPLSSVRVYGRTMLEDYKEHIEHQARLSRTRNGEPDNAERNSPSFLRGPRTVDSMRYVGVASGIWNGFELAHGGLEELLAFESERQQDLRTTMTTTVAATESAPKVGSTGAAVHEIRAQLQSLLEDAGEWEAAVLEEPSENVLVGLSNRVSRLERYLRRERRLTETLAMKTQLVVEELDQLVHTLDIRVSSLAVTIEKEIEKTSKVLKSHSRLLASKIVLLEQQLVAQENATLEIALEMRTALDLRGSGGWGLLSFVGLVIVTIFVSVLIHMILNLVGDAASGRSLFSPSPSPHPPGSPRAPPWKYAASVLDAGQHPGAAVLWNDVSEEEEVLDDGGADGVLMGRMHGTTPRPGYRARRRLRGAHNRHHSFGGFESDDPPSSPRFAHET